MKSVFLILILLSFSPAFANPCHQNLGAFDIGSGSTKAFAALVDTCEERILETLIDEKIQISFKEGLEKSATNDISQALIAEATTKIGKLVRRMKEKKVTSISAVATAAFRTAKNGKLAAAKISKGLEIPVAVITQEQEANLGALAALTQIPKGERGRRLIFVWDIGGGSMQMWTRDKMKKPLLFTGDLASVGFKNQIIREIQMKDPKKISSPNPLGKDYLRAVEHARLQAQKKVPVQFKKESSKARWLGIGGVLAISVQRQVDPSAQFFTRETLEKTLKARAFLKDSEIASDYKTTEISNLALVLGYMKALGIEKVETFDASLAQGWIFHQLKSR